MSRVTRSRTRSYLLGANKSVSWTGSNPPGTPTTTTYTFSESCADSHGRPVIPSPLDLTRVERSVFSCDLESTVGISHRRYDEWFPNGVVTSAGMTPLAAPAGLNLTIAARSNPSRPELTIPELIQDLVELPSMIRDLGNQLKSPKKNLRPSGASSTYLGITFGWLPLIKDIQDLANFQDLVNRRDKELNKLYSGSGLNRKFRVEDTNTTTSQVFTWLANPSSQGKTTISINDAKRSWATIKWRPTQPPKYHPHTDDYNRQLKKLVLGLTPEGAVKGLWNVIPWTWLMGWFSNFGSYLQQFSNTVPATHEDVCFMSEVRRTYQVGSTTYTVPLTSRKGSDPSGTAILVRKTRSVLQHALVAGSLPYLGNEKLSILGTLFTQRFLR